MTMMKRICSTALAFGFLAGTAAAQSSPPVTVIPSMQSPPVTMTATAPEWTTGTYLYDGSGNVKTIGTDQYTYDRFGRVTSGTAGPGHTSSYTYDRFGNMLTQTLDGTTVRLGANTSTNRLTNTTVSGQPAYFGTYDAGGRMTGLADGSTFTYDGLHMMTSSAGTPDGKRKVYVYTASDERIAAIEVVGGAESRSEWTLRDASGKVLRRYDKSRSSTVWQTTWRQDYIYAGNQLLASEIDTAPRTLHYFADHLGTPRLITGNGGMKVATHTYLPFGSEASSVISQTAGFSPEHDRLKFTGHERDSSALDYMHARYYGAGLGRFLSVDPVLEIDKALLQPQRWNRFSYVINNPLRWTDPTGRCVAACVGDVIIGGVVGTVVVGGIVYGVLHNVFSERTDPYAPDRKLPTDPVTGNPVIDDGVVGPHTQLGKRTSKSTGETYVQGREFDEHGNRVKDIDHTDHDRKDHPKPHEHPYDPATGKRGPQQPLQPGVKPEPKPQPKPPEPKPKPEPQVVPPCTSKTVC